MTPDASPPRGFPEEEFRGRIENAQSLMRAQGLDALLLTTEADFRYFTGFLTRFWESPTRSWRLLAPASGPPIAVIPTIGEHLMRSTWIRDVRSWRAPDYGDEGIGLLADAIAECAGEGGRIGTPSGRETHLRLPLDDWAALHGAIGDRSLVGDGGVMRRLRSIKSDREIDKVRRACGIADRAFARLPNVVREGDALETAFRRFQALCLDEGADWIGYLAGAAGPGGYADVISPADTQPLAAGDVLMLDTGVVWDGYYCDFDRNFAVGEPSAAAADAHARLIDAADAAFEASRPGATAAALHAEMARVLGDRAVDGRFGHGLGMQLTEPPSLQPEDHEPLAPGMVLTLEPAIAVEDGRILVHEENIAVRDGGAERLSARASRVMAQLEATG